MAKGVEKMRKKRKILGILLVLVLTLGGKGEGFPLQLDADSLNYDPSMQKVLAQGHVTLRQGESIMTAKTAECRTDGSVFVLRGAVSADLKEEKITLGSEEVLYYAGDKGRLVASGDVILRRGRDAMSCDVVVWRFGPVPSYHAGDESIWLGKKNTFGRRRSAGTGRSFVPATWSASRTKSRG